MSPSRPKTASVGKTARPKRATSYDVARQAGVSQATVSRCFMPGTRVSAVYRERILAVADELGYRPNAIARSLITSRSNLVAIIISNLTNLYYPEVLSELTQRFSERGIRVLLFTLPTESDIDPVIEQVWQYRVDGVIAAAHLSEKQAAEFQQHHIPVVLFNRSQRKAAVSSVCCNQLQGARTIVDRLYAAGHRRYAVVLGPSDSNVSRERLRGILASLKKRGVEAPLVVHGDYGYDGGVRALHEIMDSMPNPPDAIICTSDACALGCMDAARFDYAKKIPQDVSIVGFDGVDAAHWRSYGLTTLRQPMREMAEAAASILLSQIEDASLPLVNRKFTGELIDGQTAQLV
jgi:DNA-binding LacI/PurR family transcriptional regulator